MIFIDREHDRVLGRVDVQANEVLELGGELGIVARLKVRMRCGWGMGGADALHRAQGDPCASDRLTIV